jgi:hypothetical protein
VTLFLTISGRNEDKYATIVPTYASVPKLDSILITENKGSEKSPEPNQLLLLGYKASL